MSDYVRIKAIRFKIDEKIIKDLKKEIEEKNLYESPKELLIEKYNLEDYLECKINEFTVNSGLDYETDKYFY